MPKIPGNSNIIYRYMLWILPYSLSPCSTSDRANNFLSVIHVWNCDRTVSKVATHQVFKVSLRCMANQYRRLSIQYSPLHISIVEPLIIIAHSLNEFECHSLNKCLVLLCRLYLGQPVISFLDLHWHYCSLVGPNVEAIITIIGDVIYQFIEVRDTKDIGNTIGVQPSFQVPKVYHLVCLRRTCIGMPQYHGTHLTNVF